MSNESFEVELVHQANPRTILGEGPIWDWNKEVLYWIDIKGKKIHCYNPSTNHNDLVLELDQLPGTVIPRSNGNGLVAALQDGFHFIDTNTKKITKIADPESEMPGNRFNDGKCDPKGRLFAGTMEIAEKNGPLGTLYMLDTDLQVTRILPDKCASVSNGIAWTSDHKTVYYIDSPTKKIDAFDFDIDTGKWSNRRSIIDIENGYPDGMTIDSEGMIWVAHWAGGCVTRWNPNNGQLLRTVKLPVTKVTSVAFGGKDLTTLYITTASVDVDLEKEPLAGSLFKLTNTGTKGLKENQFGA